MIFSGSKIYTILAVVTAIGLLGLSNCKPPDEPFDVTDTPVFALKGSIDGKPLQIVAGADDYYMYTDYKLDTADTVYTFSGRFAKANCTNCGDIVEILISDADLYSGSPTVNMATALRNPIALSDPTVLLSKKYAVQLIAEDSGYISPQYHWDFGNGDTSVLKSPTPVFNDTLKKNICLTITDGTCTKVTCNELVPFEVDKGDSVVPSFDYIVNKTVVFKNVSRGLSYLWDFGDGNTSVAYEPEHLYDNNGTYRVCVTVQTEVATHKYCRNVVVKDPSFSCVANFAYSQPSVSGVPQTSTSKAVIRYTTSNGQVYESDLKGQPAGAFFNLLSHKNYKRNELGEKTESLNITFKCRVFNTNGSDFKDIEITNGVIAVAHP